MNDAAAHEFQFASAEHQLETAISGIWLFLATEAGLPILRDNHATQTALGAEIVFLGPEELAARFPWLNVADIAAGTFGTRNEGWTDPYGLLQAFRRKARSLGVEYVKDEPVALGLQHVGQAA